MLTWQIYENYLKKNFTVQVTSATPGDKEPRFLFLEKAKETYKLDNYSELESTLGRFFQSTKDAYLNTSNLTYYHELPDLLCNNEDGDICLRTWEEMFPDRSTVRFGLKKTDNQEISSEVWGILKRIHDDWRTNMTRANSLEAQGEEINQLLKEAELHLQLEWIKTKYPHLKEKLTQWISEYDKLEDVEKTEERINKLNRRIRKAYSAFNLREREEQTSKEKSFWGKLKDYKSWDWTTIIIGAIITLVILLIFRYLVKWFGGKN